MSAVSGSQSENHACRETLAIEAGVMRQSLSRRLPWRGPLRCGVSLTARAWRTVSLLGVLLLSCTLSPEGAADDAVTVVTERTPANDSELRYWLQNMVGYHRYSVAEAASATGLTATAVSAALERLAIHPGADVPDGERLFVLPYPGGRHPRIGFLEGAIDPQRETKVSIFTPWHDPRAEQADYVVADVPEAVWSNLGLTYLAHTHVPTLWSQKNIPLEPLEWTRQDDGVLSLERRLPNGIAFTSTVHPRKDHVRLRMTLTNGTPERLTGLRVQMCVMLKGANGFTAQTNDNKVFQAPYAAAHDATGQRWVISAWLPNQRTWGNERCPCLHSDPQFADCDPGQTETIEGWLSFYEGRDIAAEITRIAATHWWSKGP